jgi:hypothetical protein
MKHPHLLLLFSIAACLAGSIAAAEARGAELFITGWERYGGGVSARVWNGSYWISKIYQTGSFRARLDDVLLAYPLYCVDLVNSFSMGQGWNVDLIPVPPDPASPPPWNTGELAWVYQHYGKGIPSYDAYKAGGVQVAIWEVVADRFWRTNWAHGLHWYSSGDFWCEDYNTSIGQYATTVLTDLYQHYTPGDAGIYFKPVGALDDLSGQGQFGGSPPVPEPAAALLLAVGLAGTALWRRAHRR